MTWFAEHELLNNTDIDAQLIVCIMLGSLIINRQRSYSVLRSRQSSQAGSHSAERLLGRREAEDYDEESDNDALSGARSPSQQQRCCGASIPDTSRFADHWHSRLLQKFPFMVEMFYWALNYIVYAMTKSIAAAIFGRGGHAVTAMAQANGIAILNLEHHSILKFLFPVDEAVFQKWLLNSSFPIMTFFNQIYSLVHIPGTVTFCPGTTMPPPTTTPLRLRDAQ